MSKKGVSNLFDVAEPLLSVLLGKGLGGERGTYFVHSRGLAILLHPRRYFFPHLPGLLYPAAVIVL